MWVDVWKCVSGLYYCLFHHLEDQNLLDPDRELQLFALNYVYQPQIQKSLDRLSQYFELFNRVHVV